MALALYILSFLSLLVHVCLATFSFAAALYYISEIVEEYTEKAKKCIKLLTIFTIVLYIILMTENFTWLMIICGILAQLIHLTILSDFPSIKIASPQFWGSMLLLLVNHYLAYKHFQEVYFSMSEILAYFTLFLWMVPFLLLVSLSANDNVLPSYHEGQEDVVTNYFSTRKRQNLINFFKTLFNSNGGLPTRTKKSY